MIKQKYKIEIHKCDMCGAEPAHWSKMADSYVCQKCLKLTIFKHVRNGVAGIIAAAILSLIFL